MSIIMKKLETDEEIRGKAYVHWRAWHEAYPGLISEDYLNKLTLPRCEELAFRWPENTIIALDGGRVIGFVCYGERDGLPSRSGEIIGLYILSDYYGTGLGRSLMEAGLEHLREYDSVCLWVLKENVRAVRFYEKCGFRKTGEEMNRSVISAAEIRMLLNRSCLYQHEIEL